MKNYGIKISKAGHDVFYLDQNNENPDLSFSSKYDVLKIAKIGSGTFNTGSSATIAHGLSYPCAFITYLSTDNTNWDIYGGRSYIDSTNLVIAKDRPVTTNYYYPNASNDMGRQFLGNYLTTYMGIGNRNSDSDGWRYDGAVRFVNVSETSSIDTASIGIYIDSTRNGDVKTSIYGMDEDNTSDLAGNPFGRTKTTATYNETCDNGITGVWEIGVTDIFTEIAGRSGWSGGNAMRFMFFNNNSDTDHYLLSSNYDQGTYLKVVKTDAVQTVYYKYVIFTNKLDSTKTI